MRLRSVPNKRLRRPASLRSVAAEPRPWTARGNEMSDRKPLDSIQSITLQSERFTKLTAARDAFRKDPCVYVTTDKLGDGIRVGVASKGLEARYRGGTGYSVDAAMHESGNFIYVAPAGADLCGASSSN